VPRGEGARHPHEIGAAANYELAQAFSRERVRQIEDLPPHQPGRRCARLADIIPFFDWLFFIPAGLREHAVDRLSLKHGDCVLDVGAAPAGISLSCERRSDGLPL
jgi:hypothetical protein